MAAKKKPTKKSRFKSEAQKKRLRDKMAKGFAAAERRRMDKRSRMTPDDKHEEQKILAGIRRAKSKARKNKSKAAKDLAYADIGTKVRAKSKTKTKPKVKARKVR